MEEDAIFLQTKESIDSIVAMAQEVIEPKLAPAKAIINDIKLQLAHGTDRIPTATIHDWAVSLSVIQSELTPYKAAYGLSSALWKIEINKSNAKSVAERRAEQKKAEIENQNIIDSADKETQKIILDYMSGMIKDMQENIYQMCSELNRIADSRTRFGENK